MSLSGASSPAFESLKNNWHKVSHLICRRGSLSRCLPELGQVGSPQMELRHPRLPGHRSRACPAPVAFPWPDAPASAHTSSAAPVCQGAAEGSWTGALRSVLRPFCGRHGTQTRAAGPLGRAVRRTGRAPFPPTRRSDTTESLRVSSGCPSKIHVWKSRPQGDALAARPWEVIRP